MNNKNLTTRLISLDVFRGITIVGMILVNSPGNRTSYHFLLHSVWNGCSFADLVFPFFIFILGVSLVFSLSKQKQQGVSQQQMLIKIIKRAVIIFLLGLFLNAFPHFDLEKLRILGVLQRIALCYLVASFLFLTTRPRTQFFILIGLLIGYWVVMTWISVPGFGAGDLSREGNLAAYLDRLLLSGHLYHPMFDPEGLLSTLPAIATALIGNLTGIGLRSHYSKSKKTLVMIGVGFVLLGAGWIWNIAFPINKALWTSSYVLWTGGLALCLFAVCYWLIEIKHWQAWSKPFEIFGVNAIIAYFFPILFLKIQQMIHITLPDGSMGNLRLFITAHLFGWAPDQMASLLYAVSYILFWLLLLWGLYRKKVFVKI